MSSLGKTGGVAFVVLILAGSPAWSQNLLTNPDFDTDLTGWDCATPNGTVTWDPFDVFGSPSSGSAKVDHGAPFDNSLITCLQCVPVSPEWAYRLSTWAYWPDDPGFFQSGSTRIVFTFYLDSLCDTTAGVSGLEILIPTLDLWQEAVSDEVVAPAESQTALVKIITWANTEAQPVRAYYDHAVFETTTIFRDGFESGTTSAWSSP